MADLRLYYAAGRMLAMTEAWPNWVEGDEFRAARDKSRSARRNSSRIFVIASESKRRGNPEWRKTALDCFASLAMTN